MTRAISILQGVVKAFIVLAGLVGIYFLLSNVIHQVNEQVQSNNDASANGSISKYSISGEPFGASVASVDPGKQYFFNMQVQRVEGRPCYVRTSWRWVMHLPNGDSVMWNNTDGEFYAGDKNENLAQAFSVPATLLPGSYTVTRLASFKCGDMEQYGKAVRSFDLMVNKTT